MHYRFVEVEGEEDDLDRVANEWRAKGYPAIPGRLQDHLQVGADLRARGQDLSISPQPCSPYARRSSSLLR